MHHLIIALAKAEHDNACAEVARLMAPHVYRHEEAEVHCHCVMQIARELATKLSMALLGGNWVRYEEHVLPQLKGDPGLRAVLPTIIEGGGLWSDAWRGYENALETGFLKQLDPKPDCEWCQGTGFEVVSDFPVGDFDWWVFGGRWIGLFSGYDPAADPDNMKPCDRCLGTGRDETEAGQKLRAANPEHKCNWCNGTGRVLKCSTEWKNYDGEIIPASRWLSLLQQDFERYAPSTVLEPDGTLTESLGYSESRWQKHVLWLTERHAADCQAVVVDAHS